MVDADIVYITVFVFVGMGFLVGGLYACNARLIASRQLEEQQEDEATQAAGATVPKGVQVTVDYDGSDGVAVDIEDGNGNGMVNRDQVMVVANKSLTAL